MKFIGNLKSFSAVSQHCKIFQLIFPYEIRIYVYNIFTLRLLVCLTLVLISTYYFKNSCLFILTWNRKIYFSIFCQHLFYSLVHISLLCCLKKRICLILRKCLEILRNTGDNDIVSMAEIIATRKCMAACRIYSGKNVTGRVYIPASTVLICQYNSIYSPPSFIIYH